ncbi:hypothetical protein [Alteraurantiacibacter palmitatis]|uniref:Isopropylmalate isomerase n=1 Tax=Alteraurantiacibacter palmitatis TaxID=2054628 RepID=A0ABV7E9A8_9SPHN
MTIFAAFLYVLIAACALFAAHNAGRLGMGNPDRMTWLVVAAAFGIFVVLRLAGVEEILRDHLREMLRSGGVYDERRDIQRPLAAIAFVVIGAMGWLALRSWPGMRSRSRLCKWIACWATAGFVPLYILRILSLHAVDVLLYRGPVRLNWVLDGALSLFAGGAALAYVVFIRQGARRRQAQEGRERGYKR